jgi:hypothetical protein
MNATQPVLNVKPSVTCACGRSRNFLNYDVRNFLLMLPNSTLEKLETLILSVEGKAILIVSDETSAPPKLT